ncbi:response regulator [Geomonas sp. RF6]|uniref:response regulator n=1 Tax=Geomonas sp. RF6 TaxID=2897342 RepID=UPI001E48E31D|nr:response regulator [Geomonas sp. RF6]UFS68969.1 response regulator [Geomonas sp. RF6]
MSLVGNLEDLGLGEILQIVSLSRRSGVLSLMSRGREARIIFRTGQVIRASSSTFQQNLGEVLIQKGIIDLTILKRALSIQAEEGFRQLLGAIMVERFGVSADDVEAVAREQIENVVYSLFAWAEGTFEFELQEIAEGEPHHTDSVQFMLQQGLNPQFLAMEGSRIIDERRHRGEIDDDILEPEPQPESPPAPTTHSPFEAAGTAHFETAPAAISDHAAGSVPSHVLQVPSGSGQPLVLVDDDPATLEALAPLLEEEGYRVFPLERSEDALIRVDTLYREGTPPALVLDLIMPRMDGTGILGGLELMELVRCNFPELRILALTDFPNEDAERRARGMGVSVLQKPSPSQIAWEAAAFAPAVVQGLGQAQGVGVDKSSGGRVNIGDELRLELGEEPALPVPHMANSTGISQLRGMLEELNNPSLGGGIILLVLRFAAEFVDRALILLVKRDEIRGLGQFGMDDSAGDADARVRSLRIPRNEASPFTQVIETQFAVRGRLDDSRWSDYLVRQLGGERPTEFFAGPIVSEGKVVALLYGDNLPKSGPIRDTDSLEIFLSQAGIAMEKALLQRRLQEKAREEL